MLPLSPLTKYKYRYSFGHHIPYNGNGTFSKTVHVYDLDDRWPDKQVAVTQVKYIT